MEHLHSEQARRVWNRVRSEPESGTLEGLIALEWAMGAACPVLNRRMGGRCGPLLTLLARRSRSRWACLQGIAMLAEGRRPPHVHPSIPQGSAGELLRSMCAQAVETAGLYRQAAGEGDAGGVPAHLGQEQLRDCARLLELLGNWDG